MTRFAGQKVDMSSYFNDGPNFGKIGMDSMAADSNLFNSAVRNKALETGAVITGMQTMKEYELGAKAAEAQAQADQESNMWSTVGKVGGGLLGAFGGSFGGGGFSDTTVTGNKLPSFTRRDIGTNMITAN